MTAKPDRSPAVRSLLAAALLIALVCGAAYLGIDWLRSPSADAVEHPGSAAGADQTQAQVVGQAKDIVTVAGLAQPTADYALVSCKNSADPPYQGTVHANFVLPAHVDAEAYFRTIAAALVAYGWKEGPPPNQHLFGRNLFKDGFSTLVYPDADSPTRGVLRIHGECRDVIDHRRDATAWVDVTERLH
jgi:hypothetical protein